MNGIAVRNVPRADAACIEALGRYGVATLHEAQGRTGLLKMPQFRGGMAGDSGSRLANLGPAWC